MDRSERSVVKYPWIDAVRGHKDSIHTKTIVCGVMCD